ncbi:MAG TPA: TM0106 family RecB-like putative nuclease [Thermotogota bacterium]|nr:TM0106 family RecB-like putative nuclease [Thermotogota bacterium]HPJ87863.1 TM0106 family RecB-like putative nuclease [Thermotogota bacterium]HPR94956.1 TM0106 family RecB-like putative nuclease [Thermotogota bacterium]
MENIIGNNEIYYLFTCPRMFYFYLKSDREDVVVENALEKDRVMSIRDYFKNIIWVDSKKDTEITLRAAYNRRDMLNPMLEGVINGERFKLSIHAMLWKKDKFHLVISHLSRRLSKRHLVLAALFVHLAEKNDIPVSHNILFLRKKNLKTKRVHDTEMEYFFEELRDIERMQEPPPASGNRICNFCSFWEKCHNLETDDRKNLPVVQIRGIGSSVEKMLNEVGVFTLNDLLEIPLTQTLEEEIKNVVRFKLQAYSFVNDTALFLIPPEEMIKNDKKKGVYFDIEADEAPYLFGFLEEDTYKYYLLDKKSTRNQQINEILSYVSGIQNNLYHYCEYENRILRQLSNEARTEFSVENQMIDIYELFIKKVYTPLRHYSLKSIAKWLGFKWRVGLDGRSSIQEYRRWLNTGNQKHLEALLLYNEDDCRATRVLKNWITEPKKFNQRFLILEKGDVNDILKRK